MVYQEDVSRVAVQMAGFDAAEGDELRKILSKKHKEKRLADLQRKFVQGALERGVDQDCIRKIWEMILSFSGYSFCKPHSASFAMVSFKSAWLRCYYPAEFFAVQLLTFCSFVGMSKEPRSCLFKKHGVRKVGDFWILMHAKTHDVARDAWLYLSKTLSLSKGPGLKDPEADFVYAYRKSANTKP